MIEPLTRADAETDSVTLSTFAAALAETADFPRAIAAASKARDLATKAGAQRGVQSLDAALRLYRASQPMRSAQ